MGYNPKLTISSAPGITANLYVQACYATAPLVEVAGQLIPPPHTSSVQVQFMNLDPTLILIKIFETTGTTAGGTIRANFSIDPESGGVSVRLDKFYHAGTSPELPAGTNVLTDASLSGWNFSLEIPGAGTREPGAQYLYDATANTITLIDPPGYQTQQDEIWVIHFIPKVLSTTPASTTGKVFTTLQTITANSTLTAADAGKGFLLKSATTTLTVNLPDLATLTAYVPWNFISQGGLHVNAVLQAFGAQPVNAYNRTNLTRIVMGQSESLTLIPCTTFWLVQFNGADGRATGELIMHYANAMNNVQYTGGQTLLRTVYVRLWEFVQSLPATSVVSDATWNNANLKANACYSLGDGLTTFRVPRLYSYRFARFADNGALKAGQFGAGQVGEFTLTLPTIQKGGNVSRVQVAGIGNDLDLGDVPITFNSGMPTYSDGFGVYGLIRC